MNDDPRVMRERERYLFHSGNYAESAEAGLSGSAEAAQGSQRFRLSDLSTFYNLGRYDDALTVADKYDSILPNEPNFPLIEGHVHKHSAVAG